MIFKVKLQVQPNTWKALNSHSALPRPKAGVSEYVFSSTKSTVLNVSIWIRPSQFFRSALNLTDTIRKLHVFSLLSFHFGHGNNAKHSDTLRLLLRLWGTAPCALFFWLPNVSWISATLPTKARKAKHSSIVLSSCVMLCPPHVLVFSVLFLQRLHLRLQPMWIYHRRKEETKCFRKDIFQKSMMVTM
jgi:hypothetical protein